MRKALIVILLLALFVGGSAGFRWQSYVTNTDTPYDEVGIALNAKLPAPLRKWGCDKLQATFAGALPPLGCKAAGGSGRDWM